MSEGIPMSIAIIIASVVLSGAILVGMVVMAVFGTFS